MHCHRGVHGIGDLSAATYTCLNPAAGVFIAMPVELLYQRSWSSRAINIGHIGAGLYLESLGYVRAFTSLRVRLHEPKCSGMFRRNTLPRIDFASLVADLISSCVPAWTYFTAEWTT